MAEQIDVSARLNSAADRAEQAADILHAVANGGPAAEVQTNNGPLPSVAKWQADHEASFAAQVESALGPVTEQAGIAVAAAAAASADAGRAETAAEAANAAGKVYPDVAAGLAATLDGQYFSVPSGAGSESTILYRNITGTAVEQTRYPSAGSVDAIGARLPRLERVASLRLPRGQAGTRFAIAVGRQLLAYLDGKGDWHSSHVHDQYLDGTALSARQSLKKRPRSQKYAKHPVVIVSGTSVVSAIREDGATPEQRLNAVDVTLAGLTAEIGLSARLTPKRRPRSQAYPHPIVIVSGRSVVLATSELSDEQRITALETARDTATAGLSALSARELAVEGRLDALVSGTPPQWLAREVTIGGEQQVMVHDGTTYRQLTSAGASWMAPVVGPGNLVRCLRDQGGVVAPYSLWPNGIGHEEGKVLLQKIVTGQSLSLGSRGYVLNPNGAYVFDAAAGGVGDLFTTSIPTELQDYCLSLQGGPRPDTALPAAFAPIREYPNGVLGETICSSWALALKRWSQKATRADLRLLAIVSGLGGVPYASLKKGTSVYAAAIDRTTDAHNLAVARGWRHIVHSISIVHGESQTGTDAATYAGYLAEWLSDYTTDVMAITGQTQSPMGMVSQMNTHVSGNQEIPLGQLLAHETNAALCLTGPKYQYPYFDSAHMQAEGYVKAGEIEARAERFALLGRKWQPLRPLSVRLKNLTITVQFSNDPFGTNESACPVGPLAFDTVVVADPGHYGFALTDPAVTIQSVSLGSDGRSVVLQLSAAPAAGAKLEYAMQLDRGTKPSGGPRGCLRDSDSRDRSRYDRAYLFNWCVAFRKIIEVEI